jgi:hypothetical protein
LAVAVVWIAGCGFAGWQDWPDAKIWQGESMTRVTASRVDFADLFQQVSITRQKTDEEIKAEFRATVHRHVHKMMMSATVLPVLLFGAGWGAMQLARGAGATKRRRVASKRKAIAS